MKKKEFIIKNFLIIISFSLSSFSKTQAQVGINTSNPLAKFHVDGSKNNPATGIPNNTLQADDVVVTNEGRVGIGIINPAVRLDLRSPISENNAIGIDYTSMSASEAGAGAIRYLDTSGGKIQVSDGSKWADLYANPTKSFVIARISANDGSRTFAYNTTTDVTAWEKTYDATSNFNQNTGVFTAPRNGIYNISYSYDFIRGSVLAAGTVESQIVKMKDNEITGQVRCLRTLGQSTRTSQVGGNCVTSISLEEGEILKVRLIQKIDNSARGLRTATSNLDGSFGFNNLTIVEQ